MYSATSLTPLSSPLQRPKDSIGLETNMTLRFSVGCVFIKIENRYVLFNNNNNNNSVDDDDDDEDDDEDDVDDDDGNDNNEVT
jgi:hypothetical protein